MWEIKSSTHILRTITHFRTFNPNILPNNLKSGRLTSEYQEIIIAPSLASNVSMSRIPKLRVLIGKGSEGEGI